MKFTSDGAATSEQIRAVQKKSMEILLYFRDFCKENGLLIYFC